MFGSLGFPEIVFILVLALLVFGPRKLPEVGRTIGKALGEFRRATGDLKRSFDQEISAESAPKPAAPKPAEQAPAEAASADADDSSSERSTETTADASESEPGPTSGVDE
ncbi:MAG: twin-arginine translocase TatA/TatE family subunit [Thermoanaerobaculia bacterium]